MVKCRIYIQTCKTTEPKSGFTDETWEIRKYHWDSDVTIDVLFPALPDIGDAIELSGANIAELDSLASRSVEIAIRYSPDWTVEEGYHHYNPEDIIKNPALAKTVAFGYAHLVVSNRRFFPDQDFVALELTKDYSRIDHPRYKPGQTASTLQDALAKEFIKNRI